MKMTLRLLAVALVLTSISVPASLLAMTASGPDGNPNGPSPITRRSQMPNDGNPFPHMNGASAQNGQHPTPPPPDGNPFPHLIGGRH